LLKQQQLRNLRDRLQLRLRQNSFLNSYGVYISH